MPESNPKRNLFAIYQLSDVLMAALDQLEGNPELPAEELEALLDALTGDINAKVEDVALAIRNNQARISAKEAEALRLRDEIDKEDSQNDRLKASLMALMNKAGISKVKGKLVSVSICQNGGVIPITITGDPKDLPEEYRKETVTYSLDRAAVEQAKEIGIDLPPTITIQPRGSHIRIS